MKKSILALLLVVAIFLTGCGAASADKWKPEKASLELVPYGKQALRIIDDYLAFEIDADEATESFEELSRRLESLGVDAESGHSLTDLKLTYAIQRLDYPPAGDRTDLEFQQIRDIIAYSIGQKVSGKKYDVENTKSIFKEEDCPFLLRYYDAPASYANAFFSEDSNTYFVDIDFDYMNGLKPLDLEEYTKDLLDVLYELSAEDGLNFFANVSYECYEQTVFSLHFAINGSEIDSTTHCGNRLAKRETHKTVEDACEVVKTAAKYFDGP